MKRILTLASLILFCLVSACKRSLSQIDPAMETKIDLLLSDWNDAEKPGCAIGIVKDGNLIFSKGYGSANLDYNIPIDSQSKFYIASTSKQFTAACIAILAIRGTIGLDDDIRKYIPEIPNYGQKITVRHLVHHTSGLRDYLGLMYLAGRSFQDYFDIQDAIDILSRQNALNFESGSEYMYSNSGYVLLAEIVNRTSGMTIRKFADENIFLPLGMKNSFFNDNRSQITKNRVVSYQPSDSTFVRYVQNFDALGDGNLLTTVEDLYAWDQNFYHWTVGGRELQALMLERGVLTNGDTLDYGFGLVHSTYKGLETVSHGGSMLGFRTQLLRFPQQQFSVIVLGNVSSINSTGVAQKISDLFLAQNPVDDQLSAAETRSSEVVHVPAETLESYSGEYQMEFQGMTMRVKCEVQNDTLFLEQLWTGEKFSLVPITQSRFVENRIGGATLEFSEILGEKAQKLRVSTGDQDHECVRVDPFAKSNLQSFTGIFHSTELDASYEVILDGDKLECRVGRKVIPLRQVDENIFSSEFGEIRFLKENIGNYKGFNLNSGRVRAIKFYRQ